MCNYNCIYCYAKEQHKDRKKVELITDFSAIDYLYERKIEEAKKYGEDVKFQTTFWGGEPFFNPHLKGIVAYLREKYNSTFFSVTNGSLIDGKLVDWLIENKFYINVSNDLLYQRNRGNQYMEDEEHAKALAKLCNAGLLKSIQFVFSRESPDIMGNLEYMLDWCDKWGVEEENIPAFGWMNIKAYSPNETSLLFSPEDELSMMAMNSLYRYVKYTLENTDKKYLKHNYERHCYNALLGLKGESDRLMFRKEDGRPMASCSVFRDGCYDLHGVKWSCPHPFEMDPYQEPVVFEYKESEHCKGCQYIGECNEICPSATEEARKLSCESNKMIFRTIRQCIYDNSDEETRRNYVSESIKDLWNHV